ncbi:response regulator [Leucobacter chromiiresistens]|uniref:Transcriptional regulatory protein n=1 Tax=Leucobacter chromiiresistens TaxID=1079994 RepID=A0A1H1A5I3_9MICO|nr:response regulator [Leucobacter chromiiresistens]SDQ34606.1 Response regulator of citrate/malate metabolism [Leucobacter chromiiresistens]
MIRLARAADDPIRVITVDDDALALELHRAHLARIGGFRVVAECTGAHAAVAALTRTAHRADLVLLDVTMPDGTGIDVLRHVRARGVCAGVIAVSGVRDIEVVREMVTLGAVQYLIKPYTFATFRDRIEAFREYHLRSLAAAGAATQHDVDRMFASLRAIRTAALPKGLAALTLERVTAILRERGPSTANEIAPRLGISREVSRRYLEYLADTRRADRRARYGARGRPQTEYAWNARSGPL